MKKALSLMLVVLLCLAFTACGDEGKAADTATTTVPSDTVASGVPSALPTDAVATTPTESSPIQTPSLISPSVVTPAITTAPQVAVPSIVGSWAGDEDLIWTFNADGSFELSDGVENVIGSYVVSGNNVSITIAGETVSGTYTVAGDMLTMVNTEGDVQVLVKAGSSVQTPTVGTVAPTMNNNTSGSDAQIVADFVAENQAELLAQFESSFTDAANGITCSSTIKAVGTGFVIDINVSALNGATDEQIDAMKQSYASVQSTFDQALATMQSGLPQLTYFTINVCDGYGTLLATIHAGN